MIYLFHGDEPFEKSEQIAALKTGVSADPSLIDLNFTELDGRSIGRGELQHHCDVLPFLGDYRLVVVSDLLTKLAGSKTQEGKGSAASAEFVDWLCGYLPTVPESTHLVLNESKKLPARHRVVKTINDLGAGAEVRLFSEPEIKGGKLGQWVERRAKQKGAKLVAGVAFDLANFIGPDLRLIDSELEKLQTYAGDRPISKEDVKLLVPYAQEASIFDMVDALGHRQTQNAFKLLARLRNEGAHPLYLLTMIVRQYRILLKVKDLGEQGHTKESIAGMIKLHPFPTAKAMAQARRYSSAQLASIYDRLLETDVAVKTGKMEANLALDLLVVELARA